jgi:hypothetical protein
MLCAPIVAELRRVVILKIRTYSELRRIPTFLERYNYLRLKGGVGESTFGFDRYLNQMLYRSRRWLRIRDEVIIRDEACDLGVYGYSITGQIIIHHINPITPEDIEYATDNVFNKEFLICTTSHTHLAIHYGDESLLPKPPIVRRPGDTTPWR